MCAPRKRKTVVYLVFAAYAYLLLALANFAKTIVPITSGCNNVVTYNTQDVAKGRKARATIAPRKGTVYLFLVFFSFFRVSSDEIRTVANVSLWIWCVSAATNGARRVRQWEKISSGERWFPGRERRSKKSVIIRVRLLLTRLTRLNWIKFLLLCYGGILVSTTRSKYSLTRSKYSKERANS